MENEEERLEFHVRVSKLCLELNRLKRQANALLNEIELTKKDLFASDNPKVLSIKGLEASLGKIQAEKLKLEFELNNLMEN